MTAQHHRCVTGTERELARSTYLALQSNVWIVPRLGACGTYMPARAAALETVHLALVKQQLETHESTTVCMPLAGCDGRSTR